MKRLSVRLATATGIVAFTIVVAAAARGLPIVCEGGPCTGTEAGETLQGSEEADQMNALGGDDELDGNGGDDVMRGGEGDDDTTGSAGDDRHFGGAGTDFLSEDGPEGEDFMSGGDGADGMQGGGEADTLIGGDGNERGTGKLRAAARRGGSLSCFRGFCSEMFGDEGPDTLKGGKGKDYMEGEEGKDTYNGGPGDDVIDAADQDTAARETVVCGKGKDVVFANGNDRVADDCERVKPPLPVKPQPR
jgi:Ca2+-binding RTX toxin-like protein